MPRVGSKTRADAHGDVEVHLVLACVTISKDQMADFLVATGRSGLLDVDAVCESVIRSCAVCRRVVCCHSCVDLSVTLLIRAERLGDIGR